MQPYAKQSQVMINGKQIQFEKDMQSKHCQLFLRARAFLLNIDDGIIETKKERITTYSDKNGGICHVRATYHGVDIGYLKGAQIEDRFGLLPGPTKKMRVQALSLKEGFNEEAILYYANRSILLNGQ